MVARVKGLDKEKAKKFFQAMGTIASSKQRTDPEKMEGLLQQTSQAFLPKDYKPFGGTYNRKKKDIDFKSKADRNRFMSTTNVLEVVDAKQMMDAFRKRQDEVFGRRAAPGVVAQTRFM